ncbi:MAG: acyl-CoA desaturase, partial [Microbacteriaceae bacterium]
MNPQTVESTLGPIRATRPRTPGEDLGTSAFSGLLKQIRGEGLLKKQTWFYYSLFAVLVLALGGVITGFILLGDSWFQLLMAAALGIVLTQFAFIAHEASHRQIFDSGPRNDRAGRILASGVVGISYAWWMNKHSRHHANPNTVGKDPDIDFDTISFREEDAAKQRGFLRWFTQRQGYLFFPILTLEGVNLHFQSIKMLFTAPRIQRRWLELSLIALRLGAYLAVVFLFLPLGMAFAFLGVQLAVFGVYMGASFAPNHKGMKIIPETQKIDYLQRQVLTSRNIVGGEWVTAFMGGLNYQVEHHLFPSMPRTSLRRASAMVKQYCQEHGISYTEARLSESYR